MIDTSIDGVALGMTHARAARILGKGTSSPAAVTSTNTATAPTRSSSPQGAHPRSRRSPRAADLERARRRSLIGRGSSARPPGPLQLKQRGDGLLFRQHQARSPLHRLLLRERPVLDHRRDHRQGVRLRGRRTGPHQAIRPGGHLVDRRHRARLGQPGGRAPCRAPRSRRLIGSPWDHARVLTKVNVAQCETQLLWERGKFQATTHDLTEALGGCVIGASVWETKAGYTRARTTFTTASRSGCTSSPASRCCAIQAVSARSSPGPWSPSRPVPPAPTRSTDRAGS